MDERISTTRLTIAEWITRQYRARALSRRTLLGCSSGSGSSSTMGTATTGTSTTGTIGTTTTTTTSSQTGSCVLIPQETVGPYPLFNDIASAAVYQRADITEGKTGVPLRLTLNIVNVNNQCAPVLTAMVYVRHTDKDGYYSVSGARDAHPPSRLSRARLTGDVAARVSRLGDECGVRHLAVCGQG